MIIIKSVIKNIKLYFKEYLAEYRKEVLKIFLFLFLGIGINLTLPILVSFFIDNLDKGESNDLFVTIAYIYIAMLFVKIIVESINSYISESLGWTISNKLRFNLLKHCVSLDFNFHNKHKVGEMIERVDGDVTFLSNFFSMFIVNIIGNTIFIIFIIIIFFTKNLFVGIVYSLIAFLAYCVFLSLQEKIIKLWTRYREDEAILYGYIQENISGREDIIGIGEENYSKNILSKLLNKVKVDFRNASFISNIPTAGFFSLLNFGDALALGIAIFLFYQEKISIGSIYLISNYVGLLNRPFIALRYELENLQKIGTSLNRISDLFNLKSSISNGDLKLDNENISISMENISFSYDSNPILKDISFNVNSGETIGIVGKTGSGKTTLIRLLAKMYEPNSGQILFNQLNIKDFNIDEFFKSVCIISQKSRIFNASIRENLTCFDSSIDRGEVLSIIEKIGLSEWVSELPNGIDTIINTKMISTGQAQLLYIARSFFNKAKIYIFDEINSNLDQESEEKIVQILKEIKKDKTVFIIAHKFKILDIVDKVLILDNGEIKLFDNRDKVPNNIIEENLGL